MPPLDQKQHQKLQSIVITIQRLMLTIVEIRWSEQNSIVDQSIELISYLSKCSERVNYIRLFESGTLIQFVLRFFPLSSKTFFLLISQKNENTTSIVPYRLDNVQWQNFSTLHNPIDREKRKPVPLTFVYFNSGQLATKSKCLYVLKSNLGDWIDVGHLSKYNSKCTTRNSV